MYASIRDIISNNVSNISLRNIFNNLRKQVKTIHVH